MNTAQNQSNHQPESNILPLHTLQTLEGSGTLRQQSNRPKNRPTIAQPDSEDKFRFDYRGRLLTVYRRGKIWYFRIQRDGVIRKLSLGNVDRRAAEVAARRIAQAADMRRFDLLDALLRRPAADRRTTPPNVPTIGRLLSTFATLRHVGERTGEVYAACLLRLLRATHPEATPEDLPGTVLNRETATKWFALNEAKAAAAGDQQAANSIKRTANSTYHQSYAIICPAAVERLVDAGLMLPTLDFKRRPLRVSATDYRPPTPALIRRTLREWLKLPRNEFLAVGLELAAGLRCGEIAQARWSWLQPARVHGRAHVKNQTGEVDVTPVDPFWTVLNRRIVREGWRSAPEDYILDGGRTERTARAFGRVGDWLRALGWQTQKTNHALRAYSGGMVALRYDIFRAQLFLRHAQVGVTERNYGHFIRQQKHSAFDPRRVRVRWAR
jgi:hypothetical protein